MNYTPMGLFIRWKFTFRHKNTYKVRYLPSVLIISSIFIHIPPDSSWLLWILIILHGYFTHHSIKISVPPKSLGFLPSTGGNIVSPPGALKTHLRRKSPAAPSYQDPTRARAAPCCRCAAPPRSRVASLCWLRVWRSRPWPKSVTGWKRLGNCDVKIIPCLKLWLFSGHPFFGVKDPGRKCWFCWTAKKPRSLKYHHHYEKMMSAESTSFLWPAGLESNCGPKNEVNNKWNYAKLSNSNMCYVLPLVGNVGASQNWGISLIYLLLSIVIWASPKNL